MYFYYPSYADAANNHRGLYDEIRFDRLTAATTYKSQLARSTPQCPPTRYKDAIIGLPAINNRFMDDSISMSERDSDAQSDGRLITLIFLN